MGPRGGWGWGGIAGGRRDLGNVLERWRIHCLNETLTEPEGEHVRECPRRVKEDVKLGDLEEDVPVRYAPPEGLPRCSSVGHDS